MSGREIEGSIPRWEDPPRENPPQDEACPHCEGSLLPVPWRTVAALTTGPLPPRQEFHLCREPACPAVYVGSRGTVLGVETLRIRPGFKTGGEGWVCYCFNYRRQDFERERARGEKGQILAAIGSRVGRGDCACDVRNPSGRCCLPEVRSLSGSDADPPPGAR